MASHRYCSQTACLRQPVTFSRYCAVHAGAGEGTEGLAQRLKAELPAGPICLEGIIVDGLELPGADLSESRMAGATLISADLNRARMRNVDLRRANLKGTGLRRAHLRGADLRGANLQDTVLSGADLSDADLSSACLAGADLSGAVLDGACLAATNLSGANLSGSRAEDVLAPFAVFSGADLTGAVWLSAVLGGADLRSVSASDADLSRANLVGAKMSGGAFPRARLTESHIISADLDGADLTAANFTSAALSDSSLERAQLADSLWTACRYSRLRVSPSSLGYIKGQSTSAKPAPADGDTTICPPRRTSAAWTLRRLANSKCHQCGYVLSRTATGEAIIIDPGRATDDVISALNQFRDRLHGILITHAHPESIGGLARLRQIFRLPVFVAEPEIDELITMLDFSERDALAAFFPLESTEGQFFSLGSIRIDVYPSRGHTPGAISYGVGPYVFPGEAIAAGELGGTWRPEDEAQQKKDVSALLAHVPWETWLMPGRGPATTAGIECLFNPFLTGAPR
ncbi:MAG: pentapeptide repeat-containing protein [Candidatus Schekmanbacteria bacterium]|nr:pentapeptide repeat-containing protein [Candidatus Schekmanbacteria bacterium]